MGTSLKGDLSGANRQPLARWWDGLRYVYPVVSRRAGGISIGINLNQDKICNFGCVYCEVNRGFIPVNHDVDIEALAGELRTLLAHARTGDLQRDPRLRRSPSDPVPHLTDIAFSGDGEPTSFRNFREVVERVIALRDEAGLRDCKIVVISNASLFHRPQVRAGLELVHADGGEIWAKLDAGTPEYFKRVNATTISYERILRNLLDLGRRQPIIIQSCFMRLHDAGPSPEEIEAYIQRLRDLLANGARIEAVQVYSVSRPPAERYVTMLPVAELESICERLREALPAEIPVRRFDGTWTGEHGS